MPNYAPFIRKGVLTKNAYAKYQPFALAGALFVVGYWIDQKMSMSCDSFHNKSMLYGGRQLKEGETIWK